MNFEPNFRKLARFETKYSFTNLTYPTKATKGNYLVEYEFNYNMSPKIRIDYLHLLRKLRILNMVSVLKLSNDLAYCGRQTALLLFCVSLKTLSLAL